MQRKNEYCSGSIARWNGTYKKRTEVVINSLILFQNFAIFIPNEVGIERDRFPSKPIADFALAIQYVFPHHPASLEMRRRGLSFKKHL